MRCPREARHAVSDSSGRRCVLGRKQGILFLLAWQLIAVQKACQRPRGGPNNPPRGLLRGISLDNFPRLGFNPATKGETSW